VGASFECILLVLEHHLLDQFVFDPSELSAVGAGVSPHLEHGRLASLLGLQVVGLLLATLALLELMLKEGITYFDFPRAVVLKDALIEETVDLRADLLRFFDFSLHLSQTFLQLPDRLEFRLELGLMVKFKLFLLLDLRL